MLRLNLFVLAILVSFSLAAADSREFFQRGTTALSAGKAEEAVTAFDAAYAAQPAPSLLFWLGEAHRAAGRDAKAAGYYRQYIAKLPSGPRVADARARLVELASTSPARGKPKRMELEELDLKLPTTVPPPVLALPTSPAPLALPGAEDRRSTRSSRKAKRGRKSAAAQGAPTGLTLPGEETAASSTPPAAAQAPVAANQPAPRVAPLDLPAAPPAVAQAPSAAAPAPRATEPARADSTNTGAPQSSALAANDPRPTRGPSAGRLSPRSGGTPPVNGRMDPGAAAGEHDPDSFFFVSYTARLFAQSGKATLTYATTVGPGDGTLYTHGFVIGRQTEHFRHGVYVGFGTEYGGGSDTLLRYELSYQMLWMPVGFDPIARSSRSSTRFITPFIGFRAGGMAVNSAVLTKSSLKPGVLLAAQTGLMLQPFSWLGVSAGLGYDLNLGPSLSRDDAGLSGYSFDFAGTLRY